MVCQCDKLKKQLKRYETKFSDLVSSYKNLIEEKKVLEATLKTLSSNTSSTCSSGKSTVLLDVGDGLGATQEVDQQEPSEGVAEGNSPVSDDNVGPQHVKLLEEKISMLSKALSSVTEGKAKMEAAFQSDRKSLMIEHSSALEKLGEEKRNAIKMEEEVRAKLRQEQFEREDESKAHSMMLKELQEILAAERSEKDVLRLMIEEKEIRKSESNTERDDRSKDAYKMHEISVAKPSEEEKCIETEADEKYDSYDFTLEKERTSQLEELLNGRQSQEEKRIVELESRLAELSDVVGNYDRKRQEDQLVIQKLRDRLENLELENRVLNCSQTSDVIAEKSENSNSQQNANEIESISQYDSTHQACQQEYKQLLEEFDLFKRKSKYKTVKEGNQEDIVEYKKRICRSEKEIDRLKVYHDERERVNLKIISGLQIEVTRSKEDFEDRCEKLKRECKLSIEQVEGELCKQRVRTMEIIADRDKEIERLQSKLLDYEGLPKETKCSYANVGDIVKGSKSGEDSVLDEIIVSSPLHDGSNLFHFTQQVAHYDAELYSCRMQILDLEAQVRDFEKREEQLLIQMQALKEEIRNLERNKSRESANMEYLKNICMQYMLTDSITVKSQMAVAISAVLMFSPEEFAQIRRRQKNGWW